MNTAKQLLFTILLWATAICSHAQSSTTAIDSAKIILLFTKADANLYLSPDTSLFYSLAAMELAEANSYSHLKTAALHRIGMAYWAKGETKQAMPFFQQSLEAAEANNDTLYIARSIGSMGSTFANSGLHLTATTYHKKALALYQQLQNHERIAISLSNIGKSFLELNQLDSAKYYLLRA